MTMTNTYRIYIKSNNHPRTINTPCNGRTYYDVVEVIGKEPFIIKLNELVSNGATVQEVRYGWGGSYVPYWKYVEKK